MAVTISLPVKLAQAGLLALLAAASGASQAQSHFEEDFDDANKPWQEISVQLPAVPEKANLLDFDAGNSTSMHFAVDARSISVGGDGVVRYTLVSRSPSGAENISYEGIRCETQERKLYAFGHKDGSWSRSRRDRWERFTGTAANRQHATLARDYFCTGSVVEGSTEQITRRLRDKRPLIQVLPSGG
ncbi:CNP1-like family protein [Noviherbaspirillum sedimenti]|uniref:CNP1-like uncharacterized domain-containing protein n=1 Tax=Noviherbaspirillum sedimenti TaxID=2320865 RepID=A0A3A3GA92_9BURK|nr:CNP1-like family protein [Noviherbaspirillum sedimenti]RJG04575.1 hypothetical protein D3878_20755 [Noviherbaspirillum sedimenti]